MINDKSRESFKEWAMTTGFEDHHFTVRDDGEFKDYDVRLLWGPWQASRESLVIELPSEEPGYLYYAPDVVAAIEAAGLKVQP